MSKIDLAKVGVVPELPDHFGPGRGDAIPADIVGAEILQLGAVSERRAVEGGGLVIDYRPAGATVERRVVFAFNELGMWVVWTGPLETVPNPGAPQ